MWCHHQYLTFGNRRLQWHCESHGCLEKLRININKLMKISHFIVFRAGFSRNVVPVYIILQAVIFDISKYILQYYCRVWHDIGKLFKESVVYLIKTGYNAYGYFGRFFLGWQNAGAKLWYAFIHGINLDYLRHQLSQFINSSVLNLE